MTDRITAGILVEAHGLAMPDFDDLKNRIEEAAAAHKATMAVDGRRYPEPEPAAVPSAPADQTPAETDDERRERYEAEASPWYEVINPRNATTSIALVHDDGSLYLPEGPDALTVEEFHFAAARDKAYRLIRVDEAMAVADAELARERAWRKEMQAAARGQRQRADNYAAEIEQLRAELANRSHDLNRAAMDAVRYADQAARLRADRAAVLREAADECDEAGSAYTARAQNEHAAGAFALMEHFRRKANEAEYVATPCSVGGCEPGGEPCSTHERLMAHAEGDHELCEPDCGTSSRMADEAQQAETEPRPQQVQCNDCGAVGDVFTADDGLAYLAPSGQIGHQQLADTAGEAGRG